MGKLAKKKKGRPRAAGDKAKFLAVIETTLIKRLKLTAIEQGVTASSILERAVAEWLRRNRGHRPNPPARIPSADKRQFLAQLDPALIKELKITAIEWNVKAGALVGEAVVQHLERQAGRRNDAVQ